MWDLVFIQSSMPSLICPFASSLRAVLTHNTKRNISKIWSESGVVVHTYNPGTWEGEAGVLEV
jgi:hypothetical protein